VTLKSERNFILSAMVSAVWIFIVQTFWPGVIPFGTWDFWHFDGVSAGMAASWPIFVWGASITVVLTFLHGSEIRQSPDSGTHLFVMGLLRSAFAGLWEEICFRWLTFLGSIATLKIVNFMFFGFLGFGLIEWIYIHVFRWVADFFTLHHLHGYLFSAKGWAVGASVLSTNALFRDGHKYQGGLGYLNSWFIGMFLFWVVFEHGLPAAILVHFVYDVIVFTIPAIGVGLRRKQRY